MFEIFGAEDKPERKFVNKLLKQINCDSDKIKAAACVGIIPYQANKNETDLLLIISVKTDKNNIRLFRNTTELIEKRYIVNDKKTINLPANHNVFIETIFLCIEIKSHDAKGVLVKGDDLYVKYNQKENCVTSKLIGQAKTAQHFLNKQIGFDYTRVSTFVYFPNIKKYQLQEKLVSNHNVENVIIYADSKIDEVIFKIIKQEGVHSLKEEDNYSTLGFRKNNLFDETNFKKIKSFYSILKPSFIEQEKLEIISKKFITKDKQWTNSIGNKLIAFTGKAGTGKTLKLLRTCCDLINDYYEPVLFLTFNKALARDISRLMQLQKISTGTQIMVKTIDQFLFQLTREIGLHDSIQDYMISKENIDEYEAVREILNNELDNEELKNKIRNDIFRDYNYVAIDEGQDWFQTERDIIMKLFGPDKIIIAAGTDQCLRAPKLANWRGDARRLGFESTIIPDNVALRQTTNLSYFCNSLSESLELDWSIKPNDELNGGEIYLFNSLTKEVIDILLSEIHEKKSNYAYVDFLILAAARGNKEIFTFLKNYNINYWDGISIDDRDKIPSIDEVRCVSLESCRGLEGWATLVFDIDKWFNFSLKKVQTQLITEDNEDVQQKIDFKYDNEKFQDFQKRNSFIETDYRYLPTWFLIPFTRAKNKLLIEIPNNIILRERLLKIQNDNKDFIHLIN